MVVTAGASIGFGLAARYASSGLGKSGSLSVVCLRFEVRILFIATQNFFDTLSQWPFGGITRAIMIYFITMSGAIRGDGSLPLTLL